MNELLVSPTVDGSPTLWQRCGDLAAQASSVRAAIAYVGRGAPDLLPLGEGDVIVVDASVPSLKAGSTSPDAIAVWLDAGVAVHSREGLHAKVLRFSGPDAEAAVVGSANVSSNSDQRLIEVALLTTEDEVVESVDLLLDQLIGESEALDADWIAQAGRIHCEPSGNGPNRERVTVNIDASRQMWIGSYQDDDTPSFEELDNALAETRSIYGSHIDVWPWTMRAGDENHTFAEDIVVMMTTPNSPDRVHLHGNRRTRLGKVRSVVISDDGTPVAVLAFDTRRPTVTLAKIKELYDAEGVHFDESVALPQDGELHRKILGLW